MVVRIRHKRYLKKILNSWLAYNKKTLNPGIQGLNISKSWDRKKVPGLSALVTRNEAQV